MEMRNPAFEAKRPTDSRDTHGHFAPFYIPRAEMPQIDETSLGALLEFLRERGISFRFHTMHPERLKLHQRAILDPAKVAAIPLDAPVIVSSEFFVLDGNHRTAAAKLKHKPLNVVEIFQPFADAVRTLFEFPQTHTSQPVVAGE